MLVTIWSSLWAVHCCWWSWAVVAVVGFIVVGACHWSAMCCSWWWVGVVGVHIHGWLLWVLVLVDGCWSLL